MTGEDFAEGALPGVPALAAFDFVFDGGERVKQELGNVGQDGGVARRDAILRED